MRRTIPALVGLLAVLVLAGCTVRGPISGQKYSRFSPPEAYYREVREVKLDETGLDLKEDQRQAVINGQVYVGMSMREFWIARDMWSSSGRSGIDMRTTHVGGQRYDTIYRSYPHLGVLDAYYFRNWRLYAWEQ